MTCSKFHWPRPKRLLAILFCLVFVTAPWGPALAQDTSKIDEKALGLLKEMSDYIGGSQTLKFHVDAYFDMVQEDGSKLKANRGSIVSLKRPKQLNIQAEGDDGSATSIWYEGSKLTMWLRDGNQVMSLDYAGTTDAMLDYLIDEYDVQLPLADLFYADLNASITPELLAARYVGLRTVDGVKCHQLAFRSPGVDWQIWIEADATPVPRRYAMDFIGEDNSPQYMANMSAWSIGGELEEYNFIAAVPDSVEKIDFTLKP